MVWVWLLGIGLWTFACSALLAAFSTFDMVWMALLVGGAGVTLGWLGMAAVLSLRRRWNRRFLLCWAAWPVAVGIVGLLHATDLPMTLRVVVSRDALSEFVEEVRTSGRTRGRAGLVWVFGAQVLHDWVYLETGFAFDGITGLVHVPSGGRPVSSADLRHLTGPWWYFRTRT